MSGVRRGLVLQRSLQKGMPEELEVVGPALAREAADEALLFQFGETPQHLAIADGYFLGEGAHRGVAESVLSCKAGQPGKAELRARRQAGVTGQGVRDQNVMEELEGV